MQPCAEPTLQERLQVDYYQIGDGLLVFTEAFHLKRRQCCGSGCRHCPFEPRAKKGSIRLNPEITPG